MNKIQKKYTSLVGKTKIFSGGLFSAKRSEPEKEYKILDIRISQSFIMNLRTKKKWCAFELLVKNDSMHCSRWTRPFPMKEVKFK